MKYATNFILFWLAIKIKDYLFDIMPNDPNWLASIIQIAPNHFYKWAVIK